MDQLPQREKFGRKPKLTIDVIKEVEILLKQGHYTSTIAQYLKINTATWYLWIKNGEEVLSAINELDDTLTAEEVDNVLTNLNPNWTLYLDFIEAVNRAQSVAEMRNLELITKAAKKSWQAAAWFLERRHRDKWGQKIDVASKNVDVSALDRFLNAVDTIANTDAAPTQANASEKLQGGSDDAIT